MMANIINFIVFELVWFACVAGAGHDWQWTGALLSLAFVMLTLAITRTRKADLILVISAVLAGSLLDTLWAASGILGYAASPWVGLAPPWIWGLWASFAITLNHSFAWLRFRYLMMALLGALAAPLSYYAGAKLGAVQWLRPGWALGMLPVSWALLLYLLCRLNHKLLSSGSPHVSTLA
jgi:hypothetical protein